MSRVFPTWVALRWRCSCDRPVHGGLRPDPVRDPIAEVVAAAGVDLQPRGHGWVGCCPFHDDSSPSMTVDAIPERFHCFGCGATGDVVDFVGRMHGLGVRDAVAFLDTGRVPTAAPAARPRLRLVRDHDRPTVAPDRAFEINALAWAHLGSPTSSWFASKFLWHARGIDLTALRAEAGVEVAGYASHDWTSLTDRLRADGVTDDELLALDLSQRAWTGALIDTLRGRLIFPIWNSTTFEYEVRQALRKCVILRPARLARSRCRVIVNRRHSSGACHCHRTCAT